MGLALDLGRAVEKARTGNADAFEKVLGAAGGKRLFRGKIVDLERRFRGAHDWGALRVEGMDADRGRGACIDFKNEYLILRVDEEVALTVPDLITLVRDGEPRTGHHRGRSARAAGRHSRPAQHPAVQHRGGATRRRAASVRLRDAVRVAESNAE